MESRQEPKKKKHWNRPKQNLVVAGVFEVNYLQVIIFSYLLGFFFCDFLFRIGNPWGSSPFGICVTFSKHFQRKYKFSSYTF